jgi:pSer/pThr/pTyr-binding forkhead associated (FHA) protein
VDGVGISHRHATVCHCGRSFLVVDEGSANGTFVGDVQLAPRCARLVLLGQSLRVGRTRIEVFNEERPAPPPDANTAELARAVVREMTSGTQGERATPWIATTSGPDAGKALLLGDEEKPYVVGRGSSADLALEDDRVSRRQLQIVRRGGEVFVVALTNNRRAWLGDQALIDGVEQRWLPGAPLTVAESVLGLFDPRHELQQKLDSTGTRPSLVTGHIDVKPTSAPIAPLPTPSAAPIEPRPARHLWSTMDTTVVIIASVAIASAAAILLWLFAPWST